MDWKDALNALKDSGDIPVDNSPDTIEETETKDSRKEISLNVVINKKGRKGKTATIIEGFNDDDQLVEETANTLKKRLGTGGSFRGNEILIQGDKKKETIEILRSLGFKVKG